MPSIDLRVIAPIPTHFFHCLHCEQLFMQAGIGQKVHRSAVEEYPEAVIQDAGRLAEWLHDLVQRYGNRIEIQVIDLQSIQGFFLSLRHRAHSYPAFIVGRRKAYVGWDREALDHVLQESFSER
jgi:hypothetical protein